MTPKNMVNVEKALVVDSMEAQDAELLAHDAYAPLSGFMNHDEYRCVLDSMHGPNGAVFSLPIVLPWLLMWPGDSGSGMY